MKRGEKCHLRCREDYAYGANPPGAGIPPNATLNFDVELIDFGPKKKEKWEMDDDEKIKEASALKVKATEKFKEKSFEAAVDLYTEAVDFVDDVDDGQDIWLACKLNIAQVSANIKLHAIFLHSNCYTKGQYQYQRLPRCLRSSHRSTQ